VRPVGIALVGAGLLLVVLLRGCDTLGDRYVARQTARLEVVSLAFDDEWDSRKASLDARRTAATETQDAAKVDKEIAQLSQERRLAREKLEQGDWRELKVAARDAEAYNHIWSFWRQLAFVPAMLVLVAGLLIQGITRDGAERWLAVALLAVIVYCTLR
jgi:hypothetical protein